MRLLLKDVRWWSGGIEGSGDLRLRHGRVAEAGRGLSPGMGERTVVLDGHLVLPGLINCHDHLQLNLFPHLGDPPYANFYEWAEAIYHPEASPLREVLAVSLADRLEWGAVKNLVAGVTTVMHHDPYPQRLFGRSLPVRIVERYGWSHSLGYGTNLVRDLQRSRGPYVIHAAEGTDARAAAEVDALDQLGVLGARTVLVHGMAITPRQRQRLAAAHCSVVWCPSSNLHLYGRTAPVRELARDLAIGLGTDSTLSGAPGMLDELRVAAGTGQATPDELLAMVTVRAAAVLQLVDGRGTLAEGAPADVMVVRDTGGSPADVLLGATPADIALVTVAGRPRLANVTNADRLALGTPNAAIAGSPAWIAADLAALRRRVSRTVPAATLEKNPLWSLVTPLGEA